MYIHIINYAKIASKARDAYLSHFPLDVYSAWDEICEEIQNYWITAVRAAIDAYDEEMKYE